MKTLTIKLDDYLLRQLNDRSKEKKVTRMELIRSAIMNFLFYEDDASDIEYIESHRRDKLIKFTDVFGK